MNVGWDGSPIRKFNDQRAVRIYMRVDEQAGEGYALVIGKVRPDIDVEIEWNGAWHATGSLGEQVAADGSSVEVLAIARS